MPLLFVLLTQVQTHAQVDSANSEISKIFEFRVDSIVQSLHMYSSGTSKSYHFHYFRKNISQDSQTFITNSCESHFISTLKVGDLEFELNKGIRCLFNIANYHELAPGDSFSESRFISAAKLNQLDTGEWDIHFSVPVQQDINDTYHISMGGASKKKHVFNFDGKIPVTHTVIDTRTKKEKKKQMWKSKKFE